MTFTATPPTTPGFYAWCWTHDDSLSVGIVTPGDDGTLWLDGRWPVTNPNLRFCKLVPADEISEAWSEGFQCGQQCGSEAGDFVNSRAKRVMEGLE